VTFAQGLRAQRRHPRVFGVHVRDCQAEGGAFGFRLFPSVSAGYAAQRVAREHGAEEKHPVGSVRDVRGPNARKRLAQHRLHFAAQLREPAPVIKKGRDCGHGEAERAQCGRAWNPGPVPPAAQRVAKLKHAHAREAEAVA
jgi:hypothetical protein